VASTTRVLLDDRLLIEDLLVGLPRSTPDISFLTTTYWYYRACRAAVAGAGGHLSGIFQRVTADLQQRAILSLLRLRDDIALPDARATVPLMAEMANRHPRLNLLNLEAVAVAHLVGATVWLSEQGAAGLLTAVLDEENVSWRTVDIATN